MHFAYEGQALFFFTTEGTKTEYIAANREVCFQVEEVIDASNWQSVMVISEARKVIKPDESEYAMQIVIAHNEKLTPPQPDGHRRLVQS